MALDASGHTQATAGCSWPIEGTIQDPAQWERALEQSWQALIPQLRSPVGAVSVTGTSGTVLALEGKQPLTPAWLYSDRQGALQAQKLGVPASWGLSHWLWWLSQKPQQTGRLTHPGDYLLMLLGAEAGITDHTSALKSGYDLVLGNWDRALSLGVQREQLPQVVRPGTVIGRLSERWGLGSSVLLVAGCTDGVAGQIASGALFPGQVCVSLGSTLIFKGVSKQPIASADGAIYSHLHPDGELWLPGAASSCGGAILSHHYPADRWDALASQARTLVPTGSTAYPLFAMGERFPIARADFMGGLPQFNHADPRFYAGLLEGVAFVERLGLERLMQLNMPVGDQVFVVGGATRSELWLQIRASILRRVLLLPAEVQPASGAAILAAAGYQQTSVAAAAHQLVHLKRRVEPVADWVPRYQELYQQFSEHWQA